jgi:hypothetical protein
MSDDKAWVNAVVASLSEGDRVLVNDRSRSLTVTGFDQDTGVGADYPYRVVCMEGNGTTYRMRYSVPRDYYPSLYTESEWSFRETATGETEIWYEGNTGRTVLEVTTAGGDRALVAEQSASEYLEATVPTGETWAADYTPGPDRPLPDRAEERLGECPECGADVVQVKARATCSGCELWCPVDEWRAYHTVADGGESG